MNETETGWAIARGELPSPQNFPEFSLFALRFSGTQSAWREQHQEHAIRPPQEYLTPEMCARIAGVPVVTLHPEGGGLTTKKFIETVIGAICFGYVANGEGIMADDGDELWCIARISDANAAAAMATGKLSTSPAVTFTADSGSELIDLQDGSKLHLEGRPALISHLAACIDAGVWDRGGPPSGIRTDSATGKQMPIPNEQPNKDIPTVSDPQTNPNGQVLDKILSHLDSMAKRLDAMEMADKGGKRHDAERDAWLAEDAAACLRDDAQEAAETDEIEKGGEPREVAADRARKARRDRVAARKDSKARQDSALSWQARAAAQRKTEADNADVQSRFDSVCQAWGRQAPPPMQGESTLAYRVRCARQMQRHCTEASFKDLDLAALAASHPAALDGIETRIYADAVAASKNPTFEDDQLHARTRTDPNSGHQITEFFGRSTIFKQLSAPTMRVTGFNTPSGRNAAQGGDQR